MNPGQAPAQMVKVPLPMTQPGPYFEDLLTGVVRANVRWLRENPDTPPLLDSGVKYKTEENEAFCTIPAVQAKGWGDCDDLAAWYAAECIRDGDSGARVRVKRSASGIPGRYHAVVQRGDGSEFDPCTHLGMPSGKVHFRAVVGQDGKAGAQIQLPGGQRVRKGGDTWTEALALAAEHALELQRAGVIPKAKAEDRQKLAALAATRDPRVKQALRAAAKAGAFSGDILHSPLAKQAAGAAIDAAVSFIPGGSLAQTAVKSALNVFAHTPGLRKLVPSFLR